MRTQVSLILAGISRVLIPANIRKNEGSCREMLAWLALFVDKQPPTASNIDEILHFSGTQFFRKTLQMQHPPRENVAFLENAFSTECA